jgi:hypothetical protein
MGQGRTQKFACDGKRADRIALYFQRKSEGIAHCAIVVDDDYHIHAFRCSERLHRLCLGGRVFFCLPPV